MNRPLCTQAVAVATILAPTQNLPRVCPGREWRASRRNKSREQREQVSSPRRNCHGLRLAGSGALRAPLPAREKPWQFWRGGENCCHGDRMGTQASVQLANTTKQLSKKYILCPTSNRLYSTSFVKTKAPGRFASSRTVVLTDLL